MTDDPEITVWQYDDGSWACRIGDERPTHAHLRDDAIFWAGWWHGRRQLGEDVTALVSGGSRMKVVDEHTRRPAPQETPKP